MTKDEAPASPKDAALKLALEALESLNETNSYWWQDVAEETLAKLDHTRISIKEALAQPAQRTWVGLTEEEINACDPSEECWGLHKIARAIEAKLKEKNT